MAAHHAVLRLAPDAYFTDGKPTMREQVRDWEKLLKAVLVSWASKLGSPGLEAARQVLQQLKAVSAWALNAQDDSVDGRMREMDFLHMLRGLDGKGMLPMLTFSFDRRTCERMAGQPMSHCTCLCMLGISCISELAVPDCTTALRGQYIAFASVLLHGRSYIACRQSQ